MNQRKSLDIDECKAERSPDGLHCNHWYDGGPCCWCNAPGMTDEEKREQGMIE